MNEINKLELDVEELIFMIKKVTSAIEDIEEYELKKEVKTWSLNFTLEEVLEILNKYKGDLHDFTQQFKVSLHNITIKFISDLNQHLNNHRVNPWDRFNVIHLTLNSLHEELKRIGYLSLIKDRNVILIGGNGSGKSSFASYLKESFMDNIVVIPAQKFLFYNNNIVGLHLKDKNDIDSIQNSDFIKKGRLERNQANHVVRKFIEDLSSVFSQLVTVICNQQIKEQHKIIKYAEDDEKGVSRERGNTILYKLNNLWNTLVPDISFDIDTINRTLVPYKNGESYSINAMSDGEKAILYYTCHVLLAKENSFIVVDEPETFLNASNFSRLWDKLESYREDCKFIYISHVIDFIITRANSDILWCKSFVYPSEWDIKNIEYEGEIIDEFPKELLTEILGARKPILFCEGEKDKQDYFVYSSIFGNDAVVCPVGGHQQVIQYTRAYNNSPLLNSNRAYGIIDSDLMSEDQISGYEGDGVYSLPFNEIEMIFLTEEVIESVLEKNFLPLDIKTKIENFKMKFFNTVEEKKTEIIRKKIKKYIDDQLSNYKVEEKGNSNFMVNEAKKWLEDLAIENIEHDMLSKLNNIIENKAYDEMLKISPLKHEVSKGIANVELDSKFEEKASNRIRSDYKLREQIKEKYFSRITFEE